MSSASAPTASPAARARTPTSAPGSKPAGGIGARRGAAARLRGFTLVELLVVMVIIALGAGVAALALRQGDEQRLSREAARLAALLEAGRAEARASGSPVRFELRGGTAEGGEDAVDYRFAGLPPGVLPPGRWLNEGVVARIDGGQDALLLGPEPLIGAQRVVLSLGEQQIALVTDGLGPFEVQAGGETAPATP